MFPDYPWVPSTFISLLVFLMLLLMTHFERRTRIRLYNIAAIIICVFTLYQLYVNLSAGLNFFHSAAYLCVGIAAIVVCGKTATFERQKLRENTSIRQEQANFSLYKREDTEEESETTKDIESKVAEKDIQLQQEQEAKNKIALEWFNAQIIDFDKSAQLDLRDCATEFVNTSKINIRAIPSRNTQYKQSDVLKISSIFLLTGKTREQCANFALTVFASYFQNTEFPTIKKKIWGKESMEKEIQEFAERRI